MGWLKNWLVGSLKSVAIGIIENEGDSLQAQLRYQVSCESDHCKLCDKIDKAIDGAQSRMSIFIASSGPKWAFLKPIRAKLSAEIAAHGDKLQAQLREGIKENGPKAIDAIFDKAQATLIANINALAL